MKKTARVLLGALLLPLLLTGCSDALPPDPTTNNTTQAATPEETSETATTAPAPAETTEVRKNYMVKDFEVIQEIRSGKTQILSASTGENLEKGKLVLNLTVPAEGESGVLFALTRPEASKWYETEDGLSYYFFAVSAKKTCALYRVSNGQKTCLKQQNLVTGALASGKRAEMRVIFDRGSIYCYLNQRCYLAVQDPEPLTGSGLGLRLMEDAARSSVLISDDSTTITADLVIWGHSHMDLWENAKTDLKQFGKVFNFGIGGTNTVFWEKMIDELSSYGAKTMVVMIGSNDYAGGALNTATMEAIDRIYSALRKKTPELKVIQITEFLQPCRLDYTAVSREFNQLLLSYEAQHGDWFSVVDATDLVLNPDGSLKQSLFRDIYHMKKEGYDLLAPRVCDALAGRYIFPEKQNYDFPEGGAELRDNRLLSDGKTVALRKDILLAQGSVSVRFSGSGEKGILFSADDSGNGYYFSVNGQKAYLYKGKTLLASAVCTEKESVLLSVSFAEGEITCSADGETLLSVHGENFPEGKRFGIRCENAGIAFGEMAFSQLAGKYIYSVGSEEGWIIDTNEEGNARFTSVTANQLLMFRDISFAGGLIEFDMTVNADTEEHHFKSADGVVFGADSLYISHSRGHYYVFGRCPWKTMTGFSKDQPTFLWEDAKKGMRNIAVGQKQHYRFVWDPEAAELSMWVNGKLAAVNPLERKFTGSFCGLFCDTANCVIENIRFGEGSDCIR